MWAIGMCAMLALPVVANAAVICPSGNEIVCSGDPTSCTATVDSSIAQETVDCDSGVGVLASCNDPELTETLVATADPQAGDSSCTWSCRDSQGSTNCTINQDDGLPVTLQKFSVD